MARGVGRAGEIAVRRALGAGSLRIVRQLLAESLLLALLGGALGFMLAGWLLSLFRALTPVQFALDVPMDGGIVLFTTAVCVVAGIVVGIVPARQATRLDVLPWLAGNGGGQTRQTAARLRHAITLPQIAVSLVLLLVAGVYVRALLRVELADLGYQPRNLLVANPVLRVQPDDRPQPGPRTAAQATVDERHAERTRRFYAQLLARLRAIPGPRGRGDRQFAAARRTARTIELDGRVAGGLSDRRTKWPRRRTVGGVARLFRGDANDDSRRSRLRRPRHQKHAKGRRRERRPRAPAVAGPRPGRADADLDQHLEPERQARIGTKWLGW